MESLPTPQPFGPYYLHAKIAQGGMSDVFIATSSQKELTGQFLAIKRLLPHLNSNKPFVNLLIHEAKIGVLLNHPCIASVFDLGHHQTDFFLAMEYVHGKSLDKILELVQQKKAPKLGVELASYIVVEVVRGLAFAHQLKDTKSRELNIIHRDISPGNILVSYLGEVKLADFGIATAENRLLPGFTNATLGKVSYISPEQAANDPVVKASDIYSLGVVYYQLLTGQLPYQGNTSNDVYKKVIEGNIAEVLNRAADLPKSLRSLIGKCLDRSPRGRPQSCPEFYALIDAILKDQFKIDFTTRTSRQYYKKKLSEWMRAAFQADIGQELEITKRALFSTHPPQIPNLTGQDNVDYSMDRDEATVFEAELADEATRHYPLTETERKKILKGLPARDAIKEFSTEETLAGLEIIDDESSPSISRSISVEQKLKISKLSRDQKENLKDQSPQMEINTAAALEQFEGETFSGAKTKGGSRLISSAGVKSNPGAFRGEKTRPAVILKNTDPAADHLLPNAGFGFRIPTVFIARFVKSVKGLKHFGRPIAWAMIVSCLVISGWLYREKMLMTAGSMRGKWNDTQKVYLQILGEVPQQQLEAIVTGFRDPTSTPNFGEVVELFNREFKRYTRNEKSILSLELNNYPTSIVDGLTKQPNLSELLSTTHLFSFLKLKGIQARSEQNAVIFIYFYPQPSSSQGKSAFPEEYAGAHFSNKGAIFAPANIKLRLQIMFSLSREIAKIFGAEDKQDPVTLMPIFPEGYANAKEKPLYPQPKAELMGKDIPLSAINKKSITSLSDVVIGPQTAHEFGWISSNVRDRLLK